MKKTTYDQIECDRHQHRPDQFMPSTLVFYSHCPGRIVYEIIFQGFRQMAVYKPVCRFRKPYHIGGKKSRYDRYGHYHRIEILVRDIQTDA